MKQAYINKRFTPSSLKMIDVINVIINRYRRQGYILTVRQLYYQLVATDVIANNLQEYKKIASLLNDARLAGLVDWDAIEDRTREFIVRGRWDNPGSMVEACSKQFHMDLWAGQSLRVFVIVEKEALTGVLERTCKDYDVPLLAARGYPSVSVIREFVEEKLLSHINEEDQDILILHLGDHDPSGIDMTRDLEDRIALFAGGESERIEIRRIALTMGQIDEQKPPENPAKSTDSRFAEYRRKYGTSSWELDALQPQYLNRLVESHIEPVIDENIKQDVLEKIAAGRDLLAGAAVRVQEEFNQGDE